jgi:hypothetical protein
VHHIVLSIIREQMPVQYSVHGAALQPFLEAIRRGLRGCRIPLSAFSSRPAGLARQFARLFARLACNERPV